jgi:hypothetical protein
MPVLPFDPADEVWSLPALSIMQPWPYLIFHAGKDIENRDWRTTFRGRFLIHAGKKFDGARGARRYMGIDLPERLDMGGIVGMAEIVDCIDCNDLRSASPWFFGKFGFALTGARPLPFRPCRGQLSFFRPDYSAVYAPPKVKALRTPSAPIIKPADPQADLFQERG